MATPKKPKSVSQMDWNDVASPSLTKGQLAKLRPANEVVPEIVAAYTKARGRPRSAEKKVSVTLRLSPKVLQAFKATGPGWQTRIGDVLEDAATGLTLSDSTRVDEVIRLAHENLRSADAAIELFMKAVAEIGTLAKNETSRLALDATSEATRSRKPNVISAVQRDLERIRKTFAKGVVGTKSN